jgi:hypothetical protein
MSDEYRRGGGNPEVMDLDARRKADRSIAEDRRAARRDYVRHSEEAAKEDLAYRKTKAIKLVEYRAAGEPAGVAQIRAEADAAEHKYKRELAASLAKASLLKVDETEREATTVRDIHATSQKIDGLSA